MILNSRIKKVGFVNNVPDTQLLSYNDLNFDEPVPEIETYRIPKYYFVDELNFMIEGTNFNENRIVHKGVSWLIAISRHHNMHTWFSMQRDNHAWVAIRQIANYYVNLGGLKPLMNFFGFKFYTQHIQFWSQKGELEKEFNILVRDLDFNLFDSFWLGDTAAYRLTNEKIEEERRLAKERKQKERDEIEQERKQKEQHGIWGKKYVSLILEEETRAKTNETIETIEEAKLTQNNNEFVEEAKNFSPGLDKKQNSEIINKKKTYHKKKKSPLQKFLDNWKN